MTTITPEHDSGICHAASENRRMILEQLRDLASQLERCDLETGLQQPLACSVQCCQPSHNGNREINGKGDFGMTAPASSCSGTNGNLKQLLEDPNWTDCSKGMGPDVPSFGSHMYETRNIKPDPSKTPLIVYPDYPPHHYRSRTPPKQADLTHRTNSRELLSGVLHSGCDCVRRNGLQDQCRRVECQGRPECLMKPEPQCIPSKISRGEYQEVKVLKEEEKVKKEKSKKAGICCKCPTECLKKKQKRSIEESKPDYHQINLETQRQHQIATTRNEPVYCCYPGPDCSEKKLKGQFGKNLLTQEIDPLRGPLLNT